MNDELNKKFEIYLTIQGQNNLSKREMIAFMQLLRIVNALRFQMTLLLPTRDEPDRLFQLRAQLEIYLIIASSFKEATKEFFNNLFKTLKTLSEETELINKLSEYDTKTKNFKNDEVLNIIDYIRNNFSFHISSNLFKDYITENNANEDMLIGIARSEMIIDQCFLPAYNALIFHVSGLAKSLTDKDEIIDWLFDKIFHEVDYFCDLLEKFGGSIIKKYGGKRLKPNESILKL